MIKAKTTNILLHRVSVGNKEVKILSGKRLLIEQKPTIRELNFLDDFLEPYVEGFKKNAPKTFKRFEHIYLPCRREGHIERLQKSNDDDSNCILIKLSTFHENQEYENCKLNLIRILDENLKNNNAKCEFFVNELSTNERDSCISYLIT